MVLTLVYTILSWFFWPVNAFVGAVIGLYLVVKKVFDAFIAPLIVLFLNVLYTAWGIGSSIYVWLSSFLVGWRNSSKKVFSDVKLMVLGVNDEGKSVSDPATAVQSSFWQTVINWQWIGWIFELIFMILDWCISVIGNTSTYLYYFMLSFPIFILYYFLFVPMMEVEDNPSASAATIQVYFISVSSIFNFFVGLQNMISYVWNLIMPSYGSKAVEFLFRIILAILQGASGGYGVTAPRSLSNTNTLTRVLLSLDYSNTLEAETSLVSLGTSFNAPYYFLSLFADVIVWFIEALAPLFNNVFIQVITVFANVFKLLMCILSSPPVSIGCGIWDFIVAFIQSVLSVFTLNIDLSSIACQAKDFQPDGVITLKPPSCTCAKKSGGIFYNLPACPIPAYACKKSVEGIWSEYVDRKDGTGLVLTGTPSRDQRVACPRKYRNLLEQRGEIRALMTSDEKCYESCTLDTNQIHGMYEKWCFKDNKWIKEPYEGEACDRSGHPISHSSLEKQHEFKKRFLGKFDWDVEKEPVREPVQKVKEPVQEPVQKADNDFINKPVSSFSQTDQDQATIQEMHKTILTESTILSWINNKFTGIKEYIPLFQNDDITKHVNIEIECNAVLPHSTTPTTLDILIYRQLCFLTKSWSLSPFLFDRQWITGKKFYAQETTNKRKLYNTKTFPQETLNTLVTGISEQKEWKDIHKDFLLAHERWLKENNIETSYVSKYTPDMGLPFNLSLNSEKLSRNLFGTDDLIPAPVPLSLGLFSTPGDNPIQNSYLCPDGISYVPLTQINTCPTPSSPWSFGVLLRLIAYTITVAPIQTNIQQTILTASQCYTENANNPAQNPLSIQNIYNYYAGKEVNQEFRCFPTNLLAPIPFLPFLKGDFYTDVLGPMCENQLTPPNSQGQIPLKGNCDCDMYQQINAKMDFYQSGNILSTKASEKRIYNWYKTIILMILMLWPSFITTGINFVWYFLVSLICYVISIFNMLIGINICPTEVYYVFDVNYQMNGYTSDQCWWCIYFHFFSFLTVTVLMGFFSFLLFKIFWYPSLKLFKRLYGLFVLRLIFNLIDWIAIRKARTIVVVNSAYTGIKNLIKKEKKNNIYQV